jgi:hypothetical protein
MDGLSRYENVSSCWDFHDGYEKYYARDLTLWEPQINELVIYNGNQHMEIRKFNEILKKEHSMNYESRILPLAIGLIKSLKI